MDWNDEAIYVRMLLYIHCRSEASMETACLCTQTRELELELELCSMAHMAKYELNERRNEGRIFSSHLS
jgi:hypothetical protein